MSLILSITIVSCTTSKPSNPVIGDILIFPVQSNVGYIYTGNKVESDSILSYNNGEKLASIIPISLPSNISNSAYGANESEITEIEKAYTSIIKVAEKQESVIKILTAPQVLLDILEKGNKDYGFCVLNLGYIRSQKNLSNQQLKSSALYFGSLGAYESKPFKYISGLLGFIVERKSKKVKFYSKVIWPDRNPTDSMILKRQTERLIQKCFRIKN